MNTYQLTLKSNQEELKVIRSAFTAEDAITQARLEFAGFLPRYSVIKCEPVGKINVPNMPEWIKESIGIDPAFHQNIMYKYVTNDTATPNPTTEDSRIALLKQLILKWKYGKETVYRANMISDLESLFFDGESIIPSHWGIAENLENDGKHGKT